MEKFLKLGLILSLMITSLLAETTQEQKEKEKKEESLIKVREQHKKMETPAEVLERIRKDGEKAKKSTIDDVLSGKVGR